LAELERRATAQEAQHRRVVAELEETIAGQREFIQALRDEIARLKGQKPKPRIRPSALNDKPRPSKAGNRPGSAKRSKTPQLAIHDTVVAPPEEDVPSGSRFKGYSDFTVAGLRFEAHNVKYRLEVWETPDGRTLRGVLPAHVNVGGGHWSPLLVSYIQHQHHHALAPQHVIQEQLRDIGVDISQGQINRILLEDHDGFHDEKESLLGVGLEVSPFVHVDDTGARHRGRNGYCTHIGGAWFAYFMSTESNSRINFLSMLRAEHTDYVLDSYALEYMRDQKLPKAVLAKLEAVGDLVVDDEQAWKKKLSALGIARPRHVKIATEGALFGSVISHGVNPNLVVISDDAGQFNVLLHALCWVHAERTLAKLTGFTDEQRAALEAKRSQVWDFYQVLKLYKKCPSPNSKSEIEDRFDAIFQDKTCFATLNHALGRLHRNKSELLLVLERPDIPLENNLSENDIREYVTRRKRSGSTRSDLGRRCRDTFASLKKTCRKLGISFWEYLLDRNSVSHRLPPLPQLVRQRAQEAFATHINHSLRVSA
jgi:uncharacterized coiled-coil protein SlyX